MPRNDHFTLTFQDHRGAPPCLVLIRNGVRNVQIGLAFCCSFIGCRNGGHGTNLDNDTTGQPAEHHAARYVSIDERTVGHDAVFDDGFADDRVQRRDPD